MGFEPITSAWKADNLPLIYTRINKKKPYTARVCANDSVSVLYVYCIVRVRVSLRVGIAGFEPATIRLKVQCSTN